jgi:hypothetical protein
MLSIPGHHHLRVDILIVYMKKGFDGSRSLHSRSYKIDGICRKQIVRPDLHSTDSALLQIVNNVNKSLQSEPKQIKDNSLEYNRKWGEVAWTIPA